MPDKREKEDEGEAGWRKRQRQGARAPADMRGSPAADAGVRDVVVLVPASPDLSWTRDADCGRRDGGLVVPESPTPGGEGRARLRKRSPTLSPAVPEGDGCGLFGRGGARRRLSDEREPGSRLFLRRMFDSEEDEEKRGCHFGREHIGRGIVFEMGTYPAKYHCGIVMETDFYGATIRYLYTREELDETCLRRMASDREACEEIRRGGGCELYLTDHSQHLANGTAFLDVSERIVWQFSAGVVLEGKLCVVASFVNFRYAVRCASMEELVSRHYLSRLLDFGGRSQLKENLAEAITLPVSSEKTGMCDFCQSRQYLEAIFVVGMCTYKAGHGCASKILAAQELALFLCDPSQGHFYEKGLAMAVDVLEQRRAWCSVCE